MIEPTGRLRICKLLVARQIAVWVAFCLSIAVQVSAQMSTTGTVTGTVTEASGASVPGSNIIVHNEGTGLDTHTISSDSGGFVVPGLAAGTYDVTVTKSGFETFKETNVIVSPAQVATVNIALKVGASTITVDVLASAAQVQTTTPEVSSEVSQEQASTLPLNGRNYQSLAFLMPGVTSLSPDTALTNGGFITGNAISVNGMGNSGTLYYVDGIWDMNTGNMAQTTITPNPDTIEQVRVLQNNYGAEYTLNGSNVMLIQTKSGTSTFHGNAFEYLRNDAMDANNYFSPTKNELKQNIYGYTLGGPLMIPKVYNTERQKTFFFWSEQWTKQHVGSIIFGHDPTSAERSGAFTTPINNPQTGIPFPQTSPGVYQIPANMLNSNALALLSAIAPLPPNDPANGFLNYINRAPTINNTRDDEIKVDHNISSKLRLMAEYLDDRQDSGNGTQTFLGSPFSTTQNPFLSAMQLAQVRLTQILSPTMVNTTSVSMNNYVPNLLYTGIVNQSQVPGFSETNPYPSAGDGRLPQINFSQGYTPLGVSNDGPVVHASDLEDSISDDWSWLRGKHYIQAGMTYLHGTHRQTLTFSSAAGGWFFSGQFTGDALADYLLGDASSFNQVSDQLREYLKFPLASPYVQDTWKVNRRLTLTAGLRYLFSPIPTVQKGFASAFEPSLYSPAEAPTVNPNGTFTATPNYNPTNGLILNGVTPGVPLNFYTNHQNYYNPSLGFAWDIFGDGKTSLRGGYGITHNEFLNTESPSAGGYPVTSSINLITPSFPNPVGAASPPATVPSVGSPSPDAKQEAINTFSLTLQHEFWGGWLVSVGGAGNVVKHATVSGDINQPLPEGGYDFNPIINTGTVSRYDYGEPYPGYGTLGMSLSTLTNTWNALEVNVKHPVGHNIFVSVAYTAQKGLNENGQGNNCCTQGEQDIYHPVKGRNNSTPPQIFSASTIWSTPWYSQGNGLMHWVLGNWQFSDVTTFQDGFPLNPGLSTSNPGLATYPNVVSGESIKGPKTRTEWFNTAAFAAPAPGYFGNARPGVILGPGVIDFDMALYKDFKIRERAKFQFRSEAFNVFNHPNFSGVSTGLGSGNYGQVDSARDARTLEEALRFEF